MTLFIIQYMNCDGQRAVQLIPADNEASALGSLLDESGEDVAEESPFLIVRDGVETKGLVLP